VVVVVVVNAVVSCLSAALIKRYKARDLI